MGYICGHFWANCLIKNFFFRPSSVMRGPIPELIPDISRGVTSICLHNKLRGHGVTLRTLIKKIFFFNTEKWTFLE